MAIPGAARAAATAFVLAACTQAAGAAEVLVRVRSDVFVPNEVTINVGDTVRFQNEQGPHEVAADDNTWLSPTGFGWVFRKQFNTPGVVPYYCTVHSQPGRPINIAMNGRINVVGAVPVPLNRGMSGAWFEPATSGQGMLLDIDPESRTVFAAWFTYERPAGTEPAGAAKIGSSDNRWLTAQGNYAPGSNATTMTLFRTTGGRFDEPSTTTTTEAGTLRLEFTSCNSAVATYTLTPQLYSDSIELTRVLPGTDGDCSSRTGAEVQP